MSHETSKIVNAAVLIFSVSDDVFKTGTAECSWRCCFTGTSTGMQRCSYLGHIIGGKS